MLKLIVAIVVVLAVIIGGKNYYNSQKAEKQKIEMAEKVAKEQAQKLAEVEKLHQKELQEKQAENLQKQELADKAKQDVKAVLTDPESAQFKVALVQFDVPNHINGEKQNTVCGTVNAKNKFGGFVGFSRFIWHSGEPVELEGGDSKFPLSWSLFCTTP